MRKSQALAALAAFGTAVIPAANAQEAFDACTVFTQEDAQKALGTQATGEPVNPKVRRPKVVLGCAYHASRDGKPVAATAQFKFLRTPDEAARAFDEARLQLQTKPMLISGAEAFWSGKTGQMHVRKGRAWITLSVGPTTPRERDVDPARTLAELLVKKL
jgi:hypothetical protein